MTIREYKGSLEGLKLCFIGDGNNMMNSLIVGGLKVGMSVSVACPQGYRPPRRFWSSPPGTGISLSSPIPRSRPPRTPTWSSPTCGPSMGQEEERQKREAAFAGYCVDAELMAQAKPDAMVQHCLPAHRGEEITEEVFEANAQYIFEEAENRLHAQKAVLVKTMGGLQDK